MKLKQLLNYYQNTQDKIVVNSLLTDLTDIMHSMELNSMKDPIMCAYILDTLNANIEKFPDEENKKKATRIKYNCMKVIDYELHKIFILKFKNLTSEKDPKKKISVSKNTIFKLIYFYSIDESFNKKIEEFFNNMKFKNTITMINFMNCIKKNLKNQKLVESVLEDYRLQYPYYLLGNILKIQDNVVLQTKEEIKSTQISINLENLNDHLRHTKSVSLEIFLRDKIELEIAFMKVKYYNNLTLKNMNKMLNLFCLIKYEKLTNFYLQQEEIFIKKILSSKILTKNSPAEFENVGEFLKENSSKKIEIKIVQNSEKELVELFCKVFYRLTNFFDPEKVFEVLERKFGGLDGIFYLLKKKIFDV